MKISFQTDRRPRIEMLALIDIVFLLLVFFIYAMLSMAVHRGLPVKLPTSSSAEVDKRTVLSVTVKLDGTIYVDDEMVDLELLDRVIKIGLNNVKDSDVFLFADKDISYQRLFEVLDKIKQSGATKISLQAESQN